MNSLLFLSCYDKIKKSYFNFLLFFKYELVFILLITFNIFKINIYWSRLDNLNDFTLMSNNSHRTILNRLFSIIYCMTY